MIIEFRVDENMVEAAWLKTIYDLVEELNCKCNTYLEETYNRAFKSLRRTRVMEIYGSATMVSWLKLRIERYNHLVSSFNEQPEIRIISDREED